MLSPVCFEALEAECLAAPSLVPKGLDIGLTICREVITLEDLGVTSIEEGWKHVETEARQVGKDFNSLMGLWAPDLHDFRERKIDDPLYDISGTCFPARAEAIGIRTLPRADEKERDTIGAGPGYLGPQTYELRFQLARPAQPGTPEAKVRPLKLGLMKVDTDLKAEHLIPDNPRVKSQLDTKKYQLEAKFAELQRFAKIAAALAEIVGRAA